MRTLIGFITGLAISGTLTYLYGLDWAERIHTARQVLEPITAVPARAVVDRHALDEPTAAKQTIKPLIPPKPDSSPVAAPATASVTPFPDAAPAPASEESASNATELAWAQFMENNTQLHATGEFPWRSCFARAAATYEVPELLLLAVARGESAFNATARSHRDAIGIMQIRWPLTAQHLGILSERQLYDPCINITAGARYLRELLDRYQGNVHHALAAYNFGPGRVTAEHVPRLAAKYSSYILHQLEQVLGSQALSASSAASMPPSMPPSSSSPPATSAPGSLMLLDFSQAHRARAMLTFLLESEPSLRLSIATSPRGAHGVYLAYSNDEEQQQSLRAINATGITIAMAGSPRPNQEGLAHDF